MSGDRDDSADDLSEIIAELERELERKRREEQASIEKIAMIFKEWGRDWNRFTGG